MTGATRPWPNPTSSRTAPGVVNLDKTIHFLGDTHFGSDSTFNARRQGVTVDDLHKLTIPRPLARVQVGDLVNNGLTSEDATALAWLPTIDNVTTYMAVGNHDFLSNVRTRESAAAAWGMPGPNYSIDFPFARMVVCCPDQSGVLSANDLNWMSAQFTAAGNKDCFVVCHWTLYNTVSVSGGSTEFLSTDSRFYVNNDSDIIGLLASHPNVKAWISGHTHTTHTDPTVTVTNTIGGRKVAHINCSAVAYTGTSADPFDPLASPYVTFLEDRLEVRWRNHGGGIWDANNGNRLTTIRFP